MNRRELLVSFVAGALAAPFSFAQSPPTVSRVGFLMRAGRAGSVDPSHAGAFTAGMSELGYVEGKSLAMDWRFADNNTERLHSLASELAKTKPDVLVAGGNQAALALQAATTTIPIVLANASDAAGVRSLKEVVKPGSNVTGVSILTGELGPKRLEMLLGMVPRLARVAVLLNPDSPTNVRSLQKIQSAGKKIRVEILPVEARVAGDLEGAFDQARKQKAEALIVVLSPYFPQRARVGELLAQHRLPSVAFDKAYAEAGCIISYGNSLAYPYYRAASYVDKILKGAKPADLPVEQVSKVPMIVNRKAATAIGVQVKPTLTISAERVIE